MKKLLLPLFLIISGFVFGQGTPFSNYQTQGNVETRWVQQGAVQGMKGLINGIYTDTTTANLGHMDFYPGAQIFTYKPASLDSGTVWIRNYNATKWLRGGGSVDITSFTFDNDTTGVICFGNGVCDTFRINNLFDIVTNIVQNFNDSTIFNINDSTLLICTGSGSSQVCDTIHLGNSNTYYFITIGDTATAVVSCDTTVTTCVGDSCYQTTLCDTTFIPGQNPIPILHFQNGVRKLPNSLIVEHGDDAPGFGFAQLYRNTWLNTFGSQYAISGKPVGASPLLVQQTQLAQLSSSIATFNHSGAYHPTWNLLDANNPVNLYFNYTDPFVIPTQGALSGDSVGYMGNRYGYLLMTNSQGSTNGFSVNDYNAKQVGIMFHTFDRFNTDGVTIFAAQVPNPYNFTTNPPTDSTLLDQRVAVFHTTHDIQFPNYPNTRNDGTAPMAFYPDADGNVKVGPVSGGSSITIINDTTFTICSFGDQLCDTFITVLADPIQYVTVINDTTLQVCDTSGNCQNVDIGGGGGGVGFDRGFFDPNQSSTGATYHQTNSYNFTVGDGATTSPSATGVFNFGNGNIVLANTVDGFVANYHNTMGGSENVVMGRNMVVRGNSNFSAGTDGTISSTSNYSASFGDANDVFCTACLTSGFGNDNYVENSFMMGSDNVNGALTAGTGIANQYSNSFILGLQNRTRGSNNIVLGSSVTANNTSGRVLAFGYNFDATEASSFNVGFNSTIPNFTIHQAGSTYIASVIANPASTGITQTVMEIQRMTSGTAVDGIGAEIDFNIETGNGTSQTSGTLISRWSTAATATRTSQFVIGGTNNAVLQDLAYLNGIGSWQWLKYGDGLFTAGTATYLIATDAAGNIMEYPPGGIGGGGGLLVSADNGLTANTATNVQLFGTIGTPATLLHNSYLDAGAFFLTSTGTANGVFQVNNTSAGNNAAIYATSNGGSTFFGNATGGPVFNGTSTNGNVLSGGSINNIGINVSSSAAEAAFLTSNLTSTNTALPVLSLQRGTTGTAAAGLGMKISMALEASDGSNNLSNEIISKWTDATVGTRTSQLDITGVNSASTGTIASFYGTGVVGIGISSGYTATRLNVVDNAVGAASIVNITSTSTAAASNLQKGLNISLSGANASGGETTYGQFIDNSHTGSGTNYGLYATASGGTTNIAIRGNAETYAVMGETNSGTGVRGVSQAGTAGAFISNAGGSGITVSTTTGLAGQFDQTASAATNDNTDILEVRRQTTGTAAAGFGARIGYWLESDAGSIGVAAGVSAVWKVATHASRTSNVIVEALNAASTVTSLTIGGEGFIQLRPITATAASAITPAEGMLVFVSDTNGTFVSIGIWCYQNGAWKAL